MIEIKSPITVKNLETSSEINSKNMPSPTYSIQSVNIKN